jgi:hypothetical protein
MRSQADACREAVRRDIPEFDGPRLVVPLRLETDGNGTLMTWDDLRARFPELQPVDGVPWLGSLFGCGLMMYGGHDPDPDYGTVLRTRYLCVLGIPLLCLGSYRVVTTDEGVCLLGREPISTRAVWLNIVVLLAALGGGAVYGVHRLTTSEGYVARQQLAMADGLVASGRVDEAIGLYEAVATGPSSEHAPVAAGRLAGLLERPEDPRVPPATAAVLFRTAARLRKAGRWPGPEAELYNKGMARVNALAASDPRGAVLVLDSVAPLAPEGDDPSALAGELLERVVAARPGDVAMVSRLAALYEARDQLDRCARLLEPLRAQLGDSEGARILGSIDARADRPEPALALLRGYTRPRLDRLRKAEARLDATVRAAQDRVVGRLRSRKAADFPYDEARGAGAERQQELLTAYVTRHVQADPEVLRAEEAYESEAVVSRAALDLGMMLLQHAQGLTDPRARKDELAEAEATFLAVQRMASQRPDYQLSLGQVYYWEGKAAEGRAEFDKLLASRGRPAKLLLAIAELLREVGSTAESRTLAEEGYRAATEPAVKNQCATLRGLLETDLDARIDWLKKGQSQDAFARALLSSDLGLRALHQGDEDTGLRQLREAAGLYEGLPDTPAKLNNAFGVLRTIARLTGDEEAHERSVAMIERAVTLEPGSSLVLSNAARARLEAALRDLIGPALDLKLLRLDASLPMLGYLHDDQPAREALVRRVADHPGIARFLALQQKVMLLAPRNPDSYDAALDVYAFTEEIAPLRALHRRVAEADLDLSDTQRQTRERERGVHEERDRSEWTASLKRAEENLARARSQGNPATLALAIDMLVIPRVAARLLGLECDLDAQVALTEEAYRAAPSYASDLARTEALLARADARLDAALPEYARVYDRTRRVLTISQRLTALLLVDGPLTRAVAADPDVRRAAELRRLEAERLPHEAGMSTWALLRVTDPEAASKVAAAVAGHEAYPLGREIRERLNPYSAGLALETFWAHTLSGRDAEASARLKDYAEHGLFPLPVGTP